MRNINVLEKIEHRVIKGKTPFVVLPLEEWKIIEDIISEISSPNLLKSIAKARKDYKKSKTVEYKFS